MGYHSFSHANLAKLSKEELQHEVQPPFAANEGDILPLPYFAFPGGNYSKAAIAAVHDAGYDAGFSIKSTLVSHEVPRYLCHVVSSRRHTIHGKCFFARLRRSLHG